MRLPLLARVSLVAMTLTLVALAPSTNAHAAGNIDEAKAADEAFITSASAFVMPVVEVDGAPIGTGTVGRVATRLREIYLEEMRKAAV